MQPCMLWTPFYFFAMNSQKLTKNSETEQKNWLKFIFGIGVCLLIRLIPFRAPNLEPILATQMPFSKAYGAWAGFLFGVLSILTYDLVTNTLGIWTLVTGSAYGALGVMAHFYFKRFKGTALSYAGFAVLGTLLFDAVTGLTIGPLFFNQPFASAFFGQIPFTAMHLLGNVCFALLLSPVIYSFVIKKKKKKNPTLFVNILDPKTI